MTVLLVLQKKQPTNKIWGVSVFAAVSFCNMSIKTNLVAHCVGSPRVTAATQINPRVNE